MNNGVFHCDRNPKKGATQHVSRHNVNKPAQNLKKKHQKLYLFEKTDPYSGQESSLHEDCLSQYRVDCASENCLSHR